MTFSIILPVKNGGEYVKECVKSILGQDYSNFNLIILDNKSTDGTLEWIQSLKDSRIIIITSEKNLSIEENWGRIKEINKNDFMTIIGHDDVLFPDYLKTMDELIRNHPNASLYQSHFIYIDEKGQTIRNCLPMDETQKAHEFFAFHCTQTLDSMGTGYMMKSKDYDQVGGIPLYSNLLFADYELWIKLINLGYKATSFQNGFKYRVHNSVSSTTNAQVYIEAFGNYVDFLKKICLQNNSMKIAIERYFPNMLYYYCESLSHRLLKTPKSKRNTTVKEFIETCKTYASNLIPNYNFLPYSRKKIRLAKIIDSNLITRNLFFFYKKVSKKVYSN